jgi:hypothetical protein
MLSLNARGVQASSRIAMNPNVPFERRSKNSSHSHVPAKLKQA